MFASKGFNKAESTCFHDECLRNSNMATIDIGEDTFDVEIFSAQRTTSTFSLRIQYETPYRTELDTVEMDVDTRQEVTTDEVEQHLQEWADGHDVATITEFEVVEEVPARRGERRDPPPEPTDTPTKDDGATADEQPAGDEGDTYGSTSVRTVADVEPVEGTDGYEPGDHIAYRVGDTSSSVYSHTTDGIVEAVPPYRRGPTGEPVREFFLVDIGDRRLKRVPIEHVVGHVSDDDGTVDQPHRLDETP